MSDYDFHIWEAEMRRLQAVELSATGWIQSSPEAPRPPAPVVSFEGGSWLAGLRGDADFVVRHMSPVAACTYALAVLRGRIATSAQAAQARAEKLRRGLEES